MYQILRRIYYRFKYKFPLFVKKIPDKSSFSTLLEVLSGKSSVAIIGRGDSVRVNNPFSLIQNVDFKIIMNRVDLDFLIDYLGNSIDAQISQPPPPFTALPDNALKAYGLSYLVSNKNYGTKAFDKFYNAYHNRKVVLLRHPDDSELTYDFTHSDVFAPTQCGSLLKIIFNVKSITKIIFVGVDFFTYPYAVESLNDENIAPSIIPTNNYQNKGIPLIEYIKKYSSLVSKHRKLKLYFPICLKSYFEPFDSNVINFYE